MSWSPAGNGVALWRRRVLRANGVRLGSSLKSLLRILRFVCINMLLCVSTLWIQIWVRRLSAASLSSHLVKKKFSDLSLVSDMV